MGTSDKTALTALEICAGAGGQALGVSRAGFEHAGLVEIENDYCETLLRNRPEWTVINADLHEFDGSGFCGVDLLAGGVPCPPPSLLPERDLVQMTKEICFHRRCVLWTRCCLGR